LSDEKIDVIEWNPNTEEFIAKALSPARVLSVYLNKESDGMPTATVVVPEDQLSLAIGRNGQNARLAAKLSGWRIDIKGLFEAVSDTLFKIHDDPKYTQFQDIEAGTIPRIEAIMGKKAEGRPISPEEYRELHNFNSRVESGLIKERRAITKQQQTRIQAAKSAVPDDAYDLPVMTLGLPTKVENLLNEAGYASVGELAYRILLIPKSISDIEGIGPSYIKQIEDALEVMIGYQPLPEEYDVEEDLVLEDEPGKEEESSESPPDDESESEETQEADEQEESDEKPSESEEDQEGADDAAGDETPESEEDQEGTDDAAGDETPENTEPGNEQSPEDQKPDADEENVTPQSDDQTEDPESGEDVEESPEEDPSLQDDPEDGIEE